MESVTALLVRFVAFSRTVTVADGTVAPEGSVTLPRAVATIVWAVTGHDAKKRAAASPLIYTAL